ncbi:hypothetical protein [Prosthecobacter sp.]|uniref:hypothetical protein n=1 Tax=Prosthecobacter sp. TaxID=1965333 RepID=UPI0037850AA3
MWANQIRPQFFVVFQEWLGLKGASSTKTRFFMNAPMEAKKSPEVKPWVRRVVEASGVFMPTNADGERRRVKTEQSCGTAKHFPGTAAPVFGAAGTVRPLWRVKREDLREKAHSQAVACEVPAEPREVLEESCAVPAEPCAVPEESRTVPEEPCVVPAEARALPEESCALPPEVSELLTQRLACVPMARFI